MYREGEVEEVDSQASSDDEESEEETSIPATKKTTSQPTDITGMIVWDIILGWRLQLLTKLCVMVVYTCFLIWFSSLHP